MCQLVSDYNTDQGTTLIHNTGGQSPCANMSANT